MALPGLIGVEFREYEDGQHDDGGENDHDYYYADTNQKNRHRWRVFRDE